MSVKNGCHKIIELICTGEVEVEKAKSNLSESNMFLIDLGSLRLPGKLDLLKGSEKPRYFVRMPEICVSNHGGGACSVAKRPPYRRMATCS